MSARNVRWLEERQDRAYDLAHRLLRAARRVSDGAIGWGDRSAAQAQRAKLNALCDRAIAVRQAGDRYGRAKVHVGSDQITFARRRAVAS